MLITYLIPTTWAFLSNHYHMDLHQLFQHWWTTSIPGREHDTQGPFWRHHDVVSGWRADNHRTKVPFFGHFGNMITWYLGGESTIIEQEARRSWCSVQIVAVSSATFLICYYPLPLDETWYHCRNFFIRFFFFGHYSENTYIAQIILHEE